MNGSRGQAGEHLSHQPREQAASQSPKRGRKEKTRQLDVHPAGLPLLDIDDLFRVLASLAAVDAFLLDAPHLLAGVTTVARAEDHITKAEDPLRQGRVARPVAIASQECQATVRGPGGKVAGGDQRAAGAANLLFGLILGQLRIAESSADHFGAYELIEKVPMSSCPRCCVDLLPHATSE